MGPWRSGIDIFFRELGLLSIFFSLSVRFRKETPGRPKHDGCPQAQTGVLTMWPPSSVLDFWHPGPSHAVQCLEAPHVSHLWLWAFKWSKTCLQPSRPLSWFLLFGDRVFGSPGWPQTCFVVKNSHEVLILLSPPPLSFWDSKHGPPHPAPFCLIFYSLQVTTSLSAASLQVCGFEMLRYAPGLIPTNGPWK